MICWYCNWGWPKQVAEIYRKWSEIAGGSDALDFGPGHVVWADENFEDESIRRCIEEANEYRGELSDSKLVSAVKALRELLTVPESIRCCEPDDYDGIHPAKFPPPKGLVMERVR